MSFFVLDSSVALTWCFPWEAAENTLKVYELVKLRGAIVPAIWHLEIANQLGIKLRKELINQATQRNALKMLRTLPIVTEERDPVAVASDVLPIMEQYKLTAYDDAYLDLAIRHRLPIGTLDRALSAARNAAGLPMLIELFS